MTILKFKLFPDDTSIIITNPNPLNLEKSVNKIIQDINEWFNTNLLSLDLDKAHFIHFVTKNSSSIDFNIIHGNKKIANVYNTKFLGLTLDNTLSWKTHTDTIIPKLSSASFALRVVKPFLSPDSLKMIYYSYFHSIMTYGLIFWGNFHHSNIIFRLQKRTIRIILGIRGRDSCREHFKNLKILRLRSQYVYSLLFLWSIMGIILRWTLRYTTSILGINWIYICQYLICQYIRGEHITLGLGCSTVCLLK